MSIHRCVCILCVYFVHLWMCVCTIESISRRENVCVCVSMYGCVDILCLYLECMYMDVHVLCVCVRTHTLPLCVCMCIPCVPMYRGCVYPACLCMGEHT